jgi:quercetin dioxygenase-like cupin family protein
LTGPYNANSSKGGGECHESGVHFVSEPNPSTIAGELLGTVQPLAKLIDYHQGAVVSRTLLKKPTGTITLFAFDRGQELSEHTAPFEAMVQVLEGQAEVIISGKPLSLTAGQSVIMPAGEPHAVKAPEPFKMLLVMIRS